MTELNDYSGPIKDDLKLEDFSKEFIVKLAREWQGMALRWEELWHRTLEGRLGKEEADKWELEFWVEQARVGWPRMAALANIPVKDAVDLCKVSHLILEGSMAFQPVGSFEIIDRNHVIWTARRCLNLEYLEKADPGRIQHVCHKVEGFCMNSYFQLLLPTAKATPLKLPPRTSRDEIACQWDITV
jgi:hypothetical protein